MFESPRRKRYERSPEADLYRRWYKTERWQRIRAFQLASEPLCRMCNSVGRVTAALVCDHVTPHRGDEEAFFAGPFQSLCKPCHDGPKQSHEARATAPIGLDGWPTA